jgi:STE24 endopeptidase
MTWKLWSSDSLKGLALGLVLGVPLIAMVLWLMQAGGSYLGGCGPGAPWFFGSCF